jgi:hypothetical protein
MPKISNSYCPMRAWELGQGEIKFPEEHKMCGKSRCSRETNSKGVFKEGSELKASIM